MERKLQKSELIELVERIISAKGSEKEIDEMICLLEKNISHPKISDLIFWNKENLTPEQIVEKAMNYKPILL